MKESEWLACTDPGDLICWYMDNVREISERKARLLVCGCLRRISDRLTDDQWIQPVEVGERFADGLVSEDELLAIYEPLSRMTSPTSVELAAIFAAGNTCAPPDDLYFTLGSAFGDALRAVVDEDQNDALAERMRTAERQGQAQMVRDMVGDPFRPVTVDAAWQTPTVVALAQAAYDNRTLPDGTLDPVRLAILADALEEAGCDNADILNHLRQPGEHVRGCWVVDLLLGKE